jgi:NTP pyrophosphatase (non-canonical NTP hydrolase)
MMMDRSIQVLITGFKAAHEKMFSDEGLRRPEYPRDLLKLYSNTEDELYELFNAIRDKKYPLVRENAANVIVAASKIIEYAELLAEVANKAWDTEK